MELEEAKSLLAICRRVELKDHMFGDREVDWYFNGYNVASGYFGNNMRYVSIYNYDPEHNAAFQKLARFHGDEAQELVDIGAEAQVERNDKMGPDEYRGL